MTVLRICGHRKLKVVGSFPSAEEEGVLQITPTLVREYVEQEMPRQNEVIDANWLNALAFSA